MLDLGALLMLAAVLMLVRTSKGTIEIVTDDPKVKVIVEQNGERITIIDPESKQQIELKAGEYTLRLGDEGKGLQLSAENLSLSRGEKKIVTVRRVLEQEAMPGEIRGPNSRWLAIDDADEATLRKWLDGLRKSGHRPTYLNGHGRKNEPRFNAVAVKDERRLGWEAFIDVGQDGYQQRFNTLTRNGMWVTSLSGYSYGNNFGFTSIWMPGGNQGAAAVCRHFIPPNVYQRDVEQVAENQGRPYCVSGFPVGQGYRMTVVFGPSFGRDWEARHNQPADDIKKLLDDLRPKGYRPTDAFVCPGNVFQYGLIMERDGGAWAWECRLDLTPEEYRKETQQQMGKGLRPQVVAGYEKNGECRYFVVWGKDEYTAELPRTGPAVTELAALDDALFQFMRDRHIPAGTIAVMKGGKLLLARGYGHADREGKTPIAPDNPLRLASVTKPVTSAAVQKLIRDGKLTLDTKIVTLLDITPPEGKKLDSRWKDITVRQLLEHKGGWETQKSFDPMFRSLEITAALGKKGPASPADVIHYMAGQPLQFDPGSKSAYSNFGYCVLGRVIEKLSGKPYIDYIRTEVLAPHGIKGFALGHSLPSKRAAGEPFYADPGWGRNVLKPDNQESVPAPDGTFYLEAMDAHGGLIAPASDVVRFLDAYNLDGMPAKTHQAGVFFGSLPGTFTMALKRGDGVQIAVLFNQRSDGSGGDYGTIREIMDGAADSVQKWPEQEVKLPQTRSQPDR